MAAKRPRPQTTDVPAEQEERHSAVEAIDAWDNNIYYLPSTYTGGTYSTTSTPPAVEISTTLPGVYYNPQSFQLISAGADGDIMTPNDNVYNFDKKN